MAYDPVLAQRIRESLSERTGITEMKQFGGIGFMVNGNMACGVIGNELVSKEAVTEGPTTDRWGFWISSLIPIIDPDTGDAIAIIGMDVDASDWNMQIFYAALPVIIGTLILLFIILVFSYMQQRNDREKQTLKESENILRQSEHRLNDIINFLPDATFVIDIEGRVITWNRAMEE